MTTQAEQPITRPRVEGEREQEILDAAVDVLIEVGYDRLTMDAVATAAKASKATLYRRWESKPGLVVDAVCSRKAPAGQLPDTGSLRDDLIAAYCGLGGLVDQRNIALLAAVVTAMTRDEEFAQTYRRDFLAPKLRGSRALFERAIARGEISPDTDVDLLAPAVAGIVLHRVLLLGEPPTPELIVRVVDQVILPACVP